MSFASLSTDVDFLMAAYEKLRFLFRFNEQGADVGIHDRY